MTAAQPVPGEPRPERSARICLVYDCRYPLSHGGAEKWLRSLAEALVLQGARVTYLHAAGRGEEQQDGIRWVGLRETTELYTPAGVRRLRPAVEFSFRVARHLRSHAGDFDLVYVHDMPILPVLAAWWGLRPSHTPWVVEWIEWWSARYWRSYAGPVIGTAGHALQRLALAATPVAVCCSDLTAQALRGARPSMPITRLAGQVVAAGGAPPNEAESEELTTPPQPPLAVFLGRFLPHKRPHLVVDAVLRARQAIPRLRLVIVGHGPEEASLRQRAAALGQDVVEVRVGADDVEVQDTLRRASVLVHPSAREGFGLVVAEANSLGVPVILVDGPDNAAPELIRPGGGITVADADPDAIGSAIVTLIHSGKTARREALANARRLHREHSVALSCRQVLALIPRLRQDRSSAP